MEGGLEIVSTCSGLNSTTPNNLELLGCTFPPASFCGPLGLLLLRHLNVTFLLGLYGAQWILRGQSIMCAWIEPSQGTGQRKGPSLQLP